MKLLCQLTADVTAEARQRVSVLSLSWQRQGQLQQNQKEKHPYIVCQLKVLLAGQLIVHSLD